MFIDCRHQQMSRTRAQLEAGTSLGPAAFPPSPPPPKWPRHRPNCSIRPPPTSSTTQHYCPLPYYGQLMANTGLHTAFLDRSVHMLDVCSMLGGR